MCRDPLDILKTTMKVALPPSGSALPSLFQGSVCMRGWVRVCMCARMCVHACVYVRLHVWMHVCACACVHMYAHTHDACMCARAHTLWVHACVRTCVRTCVHVYTYMCVHAHCGCMYVYVHVYAYMCGCMCVFRVCVDTPGAVSSEGGSTAGLPSTLCGHSPCLFVPQCLRL